MYAQVTCCSAPLIRIHLIYFKDTQRYDTQEHDIIDNVLLKYLLLYSNLYVLNQVGLKQDRSSSIGENSLFKITISLPLNIQQVTQSCVNCKQ